MILPRGAQRKGGGGPRPRVSPQASPRTGCAWWRKRVSLRPVRRNPCSSFTSNARAAFAPSTASRSPSPALRGRIWGVAVLLFASPALVDPQLVETGVGRFAQFADVSSIEREGDLARMRSLQVTEEGFRIGEALYVGGWSRWAFNCRTRTADRLDFASLRADGVEGPATPDPAPPYPAAPGGDAAELLAVACGEAATTETLSLDEAIRRGQVALDQ
jgi:hypothetical protein